MLAVLGGPVLFLVGPALLVLLIPLSFVVSPLVFGAVTTLVLAIVMVREWLSLGAPRRNSPSLTNCGFEEPEYALGLTLRPETSNR